MKKVLLLLVCLLLFFCSAIFTYAYPLILDWEYSDLSFFSEFRQAVMDQDEEKILRLRDSVESDPRILKYIYLEEFPETVEEAESLLRTYDQYVAFLFFSGGSVRKYTLQIPIINTGHELFLSTTSVSGWVLEGRIHTSVENATILDESHLVAGQLYTETGEAVEFRKSELKNELFSPRYYGVLKTSVNGQEFVFQITIHNEDEDKSAIPPFDQFGTISVKTFTEMTPASGSQSAGLPETDLKWWYIALPVGGGIAVVGSLAAVLLLRKKKKQ